MGEEHQIRQSSSRLEKFIAELAALSADDLRQVGEQIRTSLASAAGEIDWWHATISLERELTRSGRARIAHAIGARARHAILDAGEAASASVDDKSRLIDHDLLIQVSRWAGAAAQVLVAPPGPHVVTLLEPWRAILRRSRARPTRRHVAA